MSCAETLANYLRENGVAFQTQQHRTAYTSGDLAAAEHIPGKTVAKTVIGFADGKLVMLVLPSTFLVDYKRAAAALEVSEFTLATEEQFASKFPDCEVGAMPPFGNLYQLPVYIDTSITADETIVFPTGTHTGSMSVRYEDFARLVRPSIVDFARQRAGYTS